MEKVLLHFQKISKKTLEKRSQFTKLFTQYIHKLVTREYNYNFNIPVIEEEIQEAMKEIHNKRAQRLDGFNVDFFKACWRIVK